MALSKSSACPDCHQTIDLDEQPEKGQKITCPNCWAYLEIISLSPLELAWEAFEDETFVDSDENSNHSSDSTKPRGTPPR
jgi:lysine biosynthesis protein LysW